MAINETGESELAARVGLALQAGVSELLTSNNNSSAGEPSTGTSASTPVISPVPTVVVALSGGADSVALLHLLLLLRDSRRPHDSRKFECALLVAHVNHKLRESSDRDEEFCRQLCATYGLPLFVETLDAPVTGENVEQWGRASRYRFFNKLRSEHSATCIVTAHHADDVVETLLMRLLANKEPRSILRVDFERCVVRPLLEIRHEELLEFLEVRSLKFFHDETNDDRSYTRNRVRHSLMPLLEKEFGTSSWRSLFERALALADDSDTFASLADQILEGCSGEPYLSAAWLKRMREELLKVPLGLQWRVVERCMHPHLKYRLGREKALEVLRVWKGLQVAAQLPGATEVRRSAGALTVCPIAP